MITKKQFERNLMENIKGIDSVNSPEKRKELAQNCDIFTSLCLLSQSYYTCLQQDNNSMKDKYKSLVNFILPFSALWENDEGKLGANGKDLDRFNPVIDKIDNYLLSLGRGKEEYKFLLMTYTLSHYQKLQANQLHNIAMAILDENKKVKQAQISTSKANRAQRKKLLTALDKSVKDKKNKALNRKKNRLAMFERYCKVKDVNLINYIENNIRDMFDYRVD